ncbi:hypothetical protein [Kibdelosporangium philippinense]|uniref:hypothetical protein n=1 Tax=Kibdelosporangium philippinense TaxID=211113 RepID=UPI00360D4E04
MDTQRVRRGADRRFGGLRIRETHTPRSPHSYLHPVGECWHVRARADCWRVADRCGAIGSAEEISEAVGKSLPGQAKPVDGAADTTIGRTDRIDCYYGLGDSEQVANAPVRVGLASYTDARTATERVGKTIADEKAAGAKSSDVTVGVDKGTLLVGKNSSTLVATHQATTVVVIAAIDTVPAAQAPTVLAKIADRALSPR